MSTALPSATPSMADRVWLVGDSNLTGSDGATEVATVAEVSQLENSLTHARARVSRSSAPAPLGVPTGAIGSAHPRNASLSVGDSGHRAEADGDDDDEDFDDDEEDEDSAFGDEDADDEDLEDDMDVADDEVIPVSPSV